MPSIILSACVLVALTLLVHTTGIAVLLRHLTSLYSLPPKNVRPVMRRLLHIVWWLILLHLAEISIWGLFYLWRGCLPNVEAAFYFSGVTYTTLGYGDVVLVKPWRMLAPIEGLVGVIMCGLSTGYFFVVVSRTTNGSPFKPPTFPSQKKHNLRNRRFGTLETILATLVGRRGSQCRGVMRQTWIKSDR